MMTERQRRILFRAISVTAAYFEVEADHGFGSAMPAREMAEEAIIEADKVLDEIAKQST